MAKLRLGILGSGKGSNMTAIAQGCASGQIDAEIVVVVSDVETALILNRAAEFGLKGLYLSPGKFRTKLDDQAEETLIGMLQNERVDLIVLAGFMRILKGRLVQEFAGRIVNIHPSLLPAFPGLNAWQQALEYGVKFSGCTVHFVDQGIDTGPIIGQKTVPVEQNDTAQTLHDRIQQAERDLYPACIAAIARGEIIAQGRRTYWRGQG